MITYLYWATVAFIALTILIVLVKMGSVKTALVLSAAIVAGAWAAYFFHFEQVFVKRFGGVMTLTMKDNEIHLGSTWKNDNLWVESYNPETNTCHFREFSKGSILQGRVSIKNCEPLALSKRLTDESKTALKTSSSDAEITKPQAEKRDEPVKENSMKKSQPEDAKSDNKNSPITLDDMPEYQEE